MSNIIDKSLDYSDSKTSVSKGTYRFQNIVPISSGGSIPILSTVSPSIISFEIPASRVFNLSRSYITIDLLAVTPTTRNIWFHSGKPMIDSLSLQTRDGQFLCNMNNASNFFFITALPSQTNDQWLSTDIPSTQTATNALNSTYTGMSRTSYNDPTPLAFTPSPADTNPLAYRLHINLGSLPHSSVFSLDKDLYFGQILVLNLGFSPSTRLCYTATTAAGATAEPILGPMTASECYLRLACEVDQDIQQKLIAKVNSTGLTLNVPYVYSWKQTNGASSSNAMQVRFNSSMGQKLLKCYSSFMNSVETNITAYTPLAVDSKAFSIRTQVNQNFLQDYPLRQTSNEIYLDLKDQLTGTPLSTSSLFATWFFYLDNFCKAKPCEYQQDSVDDGMDLTKEEIIYSVNTYLTGTAHVEYLHAVVQRTLQISQGQVLIR